jgi:hypothetical protein
VDLGLWGQNATFFFQAFFNQNFDVFCRKTAFREVDLDLSGQNTTFFS